MPTSTELDYRTSPRLRPQAVCGNVSPRNRVRWVLLLPPLVLVVLGFAALPFDLEVTRWFLNGHCPRPIMKWLSIAEAFAYGLGVAAILLTILLLDRSRWRTVVRLAVGAFGAGLLANVVKLIVARSRPHSFVSTAGCSTHSSAGFLLATAAPPAKVAPPPTWLRRRAWQSA